MSGFSSTKPSRPKGGRPKGSTHRRPHCAGEQMAPRGNNLFKRNDGLRALRIARDGGLEPAMMEIVAKDGTTFRVYGENSSPPEQGTKAWDEAITKLKEKPKSARSSAPTRR